MSCKTHVKCVKQAGIKQASAFHYIIVPSLLGIGGK